MSSAAYIQLLSCLKNSSRSKLPSRPVPNTHKKAQTVAVFEFVKRVETKNEKAIRQFPLHGNRAN